MTAEERARRVLVDAGFGTLEERIAAAIREAQAEAMERVAGRVAVIDVCDTCLIYREVCGVFRVERAGPGEGVKITGGLGSFAAALDALTPEERAAWERSEG